MAKYPLTDRQKDLIVPPIIAIGAKIALILRPFTM